MPFTTIGNLLDIVTDLERRAQAFYADLLDQSTNNNMRFPAYCLSRQRRPLSAVMEDCEPDLRENSLNPKNKMSP